MKPTAYETFDKYERIYVSVMEKINKFQNPYTHTREKKNNFCLLRTSGYKTIPSLEMDFQTGIKSEPIKSIAQSSTTTNQQLMQQFSEKFDHSNACDIFCFRNLILLMQTETILFIRKQFE